MTRTNFRPADLLPPVLARRVQVDPVTGCWLWQGAVNRVNGRPRCKLKINGHTETLAYRAALRWHYGDPLPGMIAAHACNQKLCIRPDLIRHARWATPGDNAHDSRRTGTHAGEHHPHTLCEADVRYLRAGAPWSAAERQAIAVRLGVSPATIYQAVTGRTWRHLPSLKETHE